jgi:hypothetical protein
MAKAFPTKNKVMEEILKSNYDFVYQKLSIKDYEKFIFKLAKKRNCHRKGNDNTKTQYYSTLIRIGYLIRR